MSNNDPMNLRAHVQNLREEADNTVKLIEPIIGHQRASAVKALFDLLVQGQESLLPLYQDGLKYKLLRDVLPEAQFRTLDAQLNMRLTIERLKRSRKEQHEQDNVSPDVRDAIQDILNRSKD